MGEPIDVESLKALAGNRLGPQLGSERMAELLPLAQAILWLIADMAESDRADRETMAPSLATGER